MNRLTSWLVRRPYRAISMAGVVAFLIAVAVSGIVGWPPAPAVHDEFSYLLAGDTFARGRLANPPHAFWQHFESFHILNQPAYASKYPPAQGMVLALGQWLTGEPIVGVWLSYALMSAAIVWMLQAWTRPRWALGGGILAAFWFVGLHMDAGHWAGYWAASYWGGAVAATGSALVLGGLGRLVRGSPRAVRSASVAIGIGLAVLANSRPYEGLLFSIPTLVYLASWTVRRQRAGERRAVRVMAARLVPIAGATCAFMMFYNYRITGKATEFPHVLYWKRYESSPVLFGGSRPPPHDYNNEVMRCFYVMGNGRVSAPSSSSEYVASVADRAGPFRAAFMPFFAIPLLVIVPLVIRRSVVLVAVSGLLVLAGFLLNPWPWLPHYAAPLVGSFVLLMTLAARRMGAWRIRRIRAGLLVLGLVTASVALSAIQTVWSLREREARYYQWQWRRAALEKQLTGTMQRHLVLVRYGPEHSPDNEWVYNGADIDRAPVIWARSLGAHADRRLAYYFADRQAWSLRVDHDTVLFSLVPLDSTATPHDSASRAPLLSCR